jgi:hypothetical protein
MAMMTREEFATVLARSAARVKREPNAHPSQRSVCADAQSLREQIREAGLSLYLRRKLHVALSCIEMARWARERGELSTARMHMDCARDYYRQAGGK